MKTFKTMLKEALPFTIDVKKAKDGMGGNSSSKTNNKIVEKPKKDVKPEELKISSLNSMHPGLVGDPAEDLENYFINVKGLDNEKAGLLVSKWKSKIEYCRDEKQYFYK